MKVTLLSQASAIVSDWMAEGYLFTSEDVVTQLKLFRKIPFYMPMFFVKKVVSKALLNTMDWYDYSAESAYVGKQVWFPREKIFACDTVKYTSLGAGLTSVASLLTEDVEPESSPVPRTPRQTQQVKPDSCERFVIPKRVVRFLNIEPEQRVYVKKDIQNQTITISLQQEDETYRPRTVTSRGMIRLSSRGFDSEATYKASADDFSNKIFLQRVTV